ncbi:MAG: HPr family phosphocarrier protein [Chloroflexota bacterium]
MSTRVSVEIRNDTGLHARPAAQFVETARKFASAITVHNGDKKGNAKSITGLLMLGLSRGTTITIEADGPDEADAVRALSELVERLADR